jgi:hypothetical protein
MAALGRGFLLDIVKMAALCIVKMAALGCGLALLASVLQALAVRIDG